MRSHLRTLAIVGLALLPAAVVAADEVRTLNRSFDASDLEAVYVDFPIGELKVKGTQSQKLMVELVIECRRERSLDACKDRAADIEMEARERDERVELWIDGFSKWRSRGMQMRMVVLVPENLDVTVDMSIGELELEQLLGSVTVDMGIGEVSLTGSEEMVNRVSLDTGIGESSLTTHRGRSSSAGVFTREISWTEGNGDNDIRIELGIGEISVKLR
jgi:hypothetical protein